MKHTCSVILFVATMLILGGCSFSPSTPCPSDQVLIDRFTGNAAVFEKLAADPQNKELLSSLGIERVIERPGPAKRIWFEVWFKYFFGPGGCMKGYAYCEETPRNLVESIDENSTPGSAEVKEIYRGISGKWYLFYNSAN